MKKITILLAIITISCIGFFIFNTNDKIEVSPNIPVNVDKEKPIDKVVPASFVNNNEATIKPKIPTPVDAFPIPAYLEKSIQWMAAAQFDNGGWGAGQNNHQNIRDPKAVQTDPATTAFCAMALARTGSTIEQGVYRDNLKKALIYLLEKVDATPGNVFNITEQTGTQPQRKLGQNIDVSMAIQFFTRVMHDGVSDAELKQRISYALDRCIGMLEETQQSDGSWSASGWAPVLNSAMANNALEMSKSVGKNVDDLLDRSTAYQKSNVDMATGDVKTDKAAGIALYSVSSVQRATAKDFNEAEQIINFADADSPAPATEAEAYEILKEKVSEEKAKKLAGSYQANKAAKQQLQNDNVISGFGNNGGEEYLSYMMTSESFVTAGNQEDWKNWHKKMSKLFEKVQNSNGTWTGQHCITSPVFCTAAVVMTLTADRDAEILLANK